MDLDVFFRLPNFVLSDDFVVLLAAELILNSEIFMECILSRIGFS
jgi:hypothetical protein